MGYGSGSFDWDVLALRVDLIAVVLPSDILSARTSFLIFPLVVVHRLKWDMPTRSNDVRG